MVRNMSGYATNQDLARRNFPELDFWLEIASKLAVIQVQRRRTTRRVAAQHHASAQGGFALDCVPTRAVTKPTPTLAYRLLRALPSSRARAT
jgi:hypothetical protein